MTKILDEDITSFKKKGDKTSKKKELNLMFDRQGNETKDESIAVARSSVGTIGTIYRARVGRSFKLMNVADFSLSSKIKDKMELFPFREVNEKCFQNYISFLKTGRRSFITVAERELR